MVAPVATPAYALMSLANCTLLPLVSVNARLPNRISNSNFISTQHSIAKIPIAIAALTTAATGTKGLRSILLCLELTTTARLGEQ